MEEERMKKIISIVMVIAMISALCITTSAEDAPAAPTEGLVAHFTFDDAESGLTGGGATAHPMTYGANEDGTNDFIEAEANIVQDETRGSGVYDFGTRADRRFLEVTKDDGSPVIDGNITGLTVSFWANSSDTQTNWYFWSTAKYEDGYVRDPGNVVDTHYTSTEHAEEVDEYVGLLTTGGNPKGELYYNPVESRDNSAATGSFPVETSTWSLITMTIDSTGYIALYVNGRWIGDRQTSGAYTFSDILGDDAITFIGMALWGNPGEFSLGQIDDYYIYNVALDEGDTDRVVLKQLWAAQGVVVEEEPDDDDPTVTLPTTEAPTTTAPSNDATTTAPTTDAAEEKGGCGSTLGVTAVAVAVTSVFGCAVIKKKH